MKQRRVTRLIAMIAGLALVAAACGNDDDDADDASPTGDDTEDVTPGDEIARGECLGEEPPAEPAEAEGPAEDGTLAANAQDINPQPRDALQDGGEFRYAIASIADNWNPNHPLGNSADFTRVRGPMSPRLFKFDHTGVPHMDTNFLVGCTFQEADEDSDTPQVVILSLNPEATWNNGDPISVEDFESAWQAQNGENEEFEVVDTEGYEQIVSVEEGNDPHEIVITFDGVYADWLRLFASLTPQESTATPEVWNDGWGELNNDWFAGPFIFDNLDQAEQVIELVPNPNWWGDEPKLDLISLRVVSIDAQPQAFANDELDAIDIGPDPAGFQLASAAPHGEVRTALGPNWRHITMNHEAGLLQEVEVRQAISQGLNRSEIGESSLAGIPWPVEPLNNRILMANQEGYEDNAGEFDYDQDAAQATLEAAGWELGADGVYARDGERLSISFTELAGVPVSENEAQQTKAQLEEIGFEVEIVTSPTDEFENRLDDGEFQLMAFTWLGTPFPFANVGQIYGTGGDSNYGRSDMPDVDALIPPLIREVDVDERIRMANEIDTLLWENMHTLPLYQRPDLYAVNADFANFGANGLVRIDWGTEYENWGWMN